MKKIILTLSFLMIFITATQAQQVKHNSVKTAAPADSVFNKPKTKHNARHHKHSSTRWSRINRQLYQARIHEAANKKAQALQDEYAKRHAADTARY